MFRTLGLLTLFGLSAVKSHSHDSDDGDDDEDVTLLGTFDMGFPSESVEYDSVNSAYYYFSAFTLEGYMLDASNTTAILNGDVSATNPFNMGNFTEFAVFLLGMYTDGDVLYINTYTGQIILVDLDTYTAYDSWQIYYNSTTVANLNGMCYDDDNDVLYVTDTGLTSTFDANTDRGGMIYAVSLDDGSYSKAYDGSDGNIYPNGCAVNDGVLYAVEVAYDATSRLIVYDIDDDTWEFYNISANADGLAFSDDGDLFYSAFDVPDGSDDGLYMISASSISSGEYESELVLDELISPADMTYNGDDSLIVIPTLDTDTFINALYFVEIDGDDDESDSDGVYSIVTNPINLVNVGCGIIAFILATQF